MKKFILQKLNLWKHVFLLLLYITGGAMTLFSQESLNHYYYYPFSIGINYQPLSSLALVEHKTAMNELSFQVRIPLPSVPVLQPFIFGGVIAVDSDEQDEPTIIGGLLDDGIQMADFNPDEVWDHQYWFGAAGLSYSQRILKEVEVGADVFFGIGMSNFNRRVITSGGEWYPVGELGLLTGITGEITLNPSFNLSIQVSPSVRYCRSLGSLHDFDGFYFGVGFSGNYRFGRDPDSPGMEIKSIQFSELSVPSLFASMQSYYAKNPFGAVTITNKENQAIENLEILFYQAGFMDSPTPAGNIESLGGGESAEIPLFASYNREVFSVEGITPLTGEIIVNYNSSGRSVQQKQPVSYDLYDKTSMTWDDDEKVAAFITPSDSALRNYTSFIRQACKAHTVPLFNSSLQFSMQAFHGLSTLGLLYQADPIRPFTEVQEKTFVVDSINIPRDTLKRITGDCDDLTVLYCSLLETVGIESGFITLPGHIYAVFNTGETSRDYRKIHTDRRMTIDVDGELWIPVEITMIGRTGFLEAWRKGAEQWNAWENEPGKRGFYKTRTAQELYRPVGLRETDLGLQYGDKDDLIAGFQADLNNLINQIVEAYANEAREGERAGDYNNLGIVYARFMRYPEAFTAFIRALDINPEYLSAAVNSANLLFLQGKYSEAQRAYEKSLSVVEMRGKNAAPYLFSLLVNLSRTSYQLTEYDDAQRYYKRAEEINPEGARQYSYLSSAGGEHTERASAESDLRYDVLFIDLGDE